MKYDIEGTLEKTNWGLALNLKGTALEEIGTVAFLDPSKNYKDYKVGEKYVGQIYFSVMYTTEFDKGNKNWKSTKKADLEELYQLIKSASDNHKNVYGKKISEKDIAMYFE
jgi:hypothetical protein